LNIAIDVTKSNSWTGKKSFQGRCLHDSSVGPSPYRQVIHAVCESMNEFSTGTIHAMRFGCSETENHSVLPLHSNASFEYKNLKDLESSHALMEQEIRESKIQMSGPTCFVACIEYAIQQVKVTGIFQNLLILTDGLVDDIDATEQMIRESRRYGVSINIVCIGDGPFHKMNEWDDKLKDKSNCLDYDNVQMVEFAKALTLENQNPYRLAYMILMEVPAQYAFVKEHKLLKKWSEQAMETRKYEQQQKQQQQQPPLYNPSYLEQEEGEPGNVH
jgi:E3 ubiquitin-protein ligase RGLG